MLRNGRSKIDWNLNFFGCSCCNSKTRRRAARHSARQAEKRAWEADQC